MVCHGISGVVNLARAKSEAFDNIYSLLKKNKNSYNVSGEGNAGERCKTTVCLISKKATLHMQHTFLYISLPLCCTTRT